MGTPLDEIFAEGSEIETVAEAPKEATKATTPQEPAPAEPETAEANPETAETTGEPPSSDPDAKRDYEAEDKATGVPPTPEHEQKSGNVPVAALADERRKRQEIERKFTEAEARAQELEQMRRDMEYRMQMMERQFLASQQPQRQARQEAPKRPDPYEDPDGAAAWDQAQMQAIRRQVFEYNQATRLEMSQAMMRKTQDDYDDVEAAFIEEAKKAPHLVEELRNHPFPAEYAYEMGKKFKAMKEIGDDPDAYRKKLREELMAELQAQNQEPVEQSHDPSQSPPKRTAPPPPSSLAGVPSVAPRREGAQKWEGPTPLEDILK